MKTAIIAAAIALGSFVTGCAKPETDFTIAIGVSVPQADHEAIYTAAATWNDCGPVHIVVTSTPKPDTIMIEYSPVEIEGHDGITYSLDGKAYYIAYTHESDLAVDPLAIISHELGHALGLGHNDNRDSIMYPKYNDARRVTRFDCELLANR